MKIIDQSYKWTSQLQKRSTTKYIILHHRAGEGDVQSIHQGHIAEGWSGIGYHFYVRKDGSVFKGRPIGSVGAHTKGYNSVSVGVCFEGNFETQTMTVKQIQSGRSLVDYLKNLYPYAEIKRHSDFEATACPGRNFLYEKIKQEVDSMTVEEATEIIEAKAGLEEGTIDFLLCYKYGEELVVKLAEAMI